MDADALTRCAALVQRATTTDDAVRCAAIAIAGALEELRSHCEDSRRALSGRLDAALAALAKSGQSPEAFERCDRLLREHAGAFIARIDSIEAHKSAALETEQVAVDSVLERVAEVLDDLRRLGTAEVDALEATLSASVDMVEESVSVQPKGPIEPSDVHVEIPRITATDAIAAAVAAPTDAEMQALLLDCFGRLVAVRAARASDLQLSGRPMFALPGKPLRFALTLSATFGELSTDDLTATLRHVSRHIIATVALQPPGVGAVDAPAAFSVDPEGPRLWVTFVLPVGLDVGDTLTIDLTVAGARPSGADASLLPFSLRVVAGLPPGWCVKDVVKSEDYRVPTVSSAARVYLPSGVPSGPPVRAYGADGAELPRLREGFFGQPMGAVLAMAEGTAVGSLVLACIKAAGRLRAPDTLVAVPEAALEDGAAGEALWTTALDAGVCLGMATLPRSGVVITGRCDTEGALVVHDLLTGALRGRAAVPYATVIAADDESGTVFVSVKRDGRVGMFGVAIFHWDGSALAKQGYLEGVTAHNKHVALAVVPRGPRSPRAHLVVCPRFEAVLRVYALPGLALVHSHELVSSGEGGGGPPVLLTTLAADPSGEALIVCDQAGDKAMFALAWPLPGMPTGALEA